MARHANNMRKQENKLSQVDQNALTTDSIDTTLKEMSEKELRMFLLKIFYEKIQGIKLERKYRT